MSNSLVMTGGAERETIDAVLFDLDGTLLDSVDAIVTAIADVVAESGVDRPSEAYVRSLIGTPLRRQMAIYGAPGHDDPRLLTDLIERFLVRHRELAAREDVFGPAIEGMNLLRDAGFPLAFVTSKSRREVDDFLTRHPWAQAADTIVSASDVTDPKPHPMSAELAALRLGVPVTRCAMVGDAVHDVHCARDAGALAIAVAYGAAPAPVLEAARPHRLFHSPEQLRAWCAHLADTKTCLPEKPAFSTP